jgi:hypothetical protein
MSNKGVRAQWEKAINKYGFESYDEEALQAYLTASPKLLKKAMSGAGCWGPYRGGSCGSCGNVAASMQGGNCGMKMHGGRIALAGEYFGLKTSPLVDQAVATDMTQVTDNYVRPSVSETFFAQQTAAPSCGGGWQHELFAQALKTYRAQNKGLRFTAQQKADMQSHFDQSFNAAFQSIRKSASKTKHLKVGMVEKAFKKN